MKNKIIAKFIALNFILTGCASSSDRSPKESPPQQPSPRAPQEDLEISLKNVDDILRQQGLSEQFKDNFVFSNLSQIDWANPATYGPSGNYVGLTTTNPSMESRFAHIGVTPNDYYRVTIMGDGSCWLRATWVGFLYALFSREDYYQKFLVSAKKLPQTYAHVPGFKERYFLSDFLKLIGTLKKLSPKDRIRQLNKSSVDTFLNYTFRAIIHAHYMNSRTDEGMRKSILLSNSWGVPKTDLLFNKLLPKEHLIMFSPDTTALYIVPSNEKPGTLYIEPNGDILEEPEGGLKILADEFGIKNIRDLGKNDFLAVVTVHTGGNHYELWVRKEHASQFGY